MTEHWGGLPSDWQFFRDLGVGEDLLPVVSNPHADISPKSTMKDKGKTPSMYNPAGQVVGIPRWTAILATQEQLDRWETVSDYGICVQTRLVRAIDVDVADQDKAAAIIAHIDAVLGIELPIRFRSNSGKCLLAFCVGGEFGKRRMTVDGGVIELLANGQQFIAAGHHPSGVLYEWNWRGNNTIPSLTMEQADALWAALGAAFATAPLAENSNRLRKPPTGKEHTNDEVLTYLEERGQVLSYGKEGQANIVCPFTAEHTGDSGETSTTYFPKGSRGYEQGHFVCKHAHCTGRVDAEFLDAVGYRSRGFKEIAPDVAAAGESAAPVLEWPVLKRTKKGIEAIINNVIAMLERPDLIGYHIRYDSFRDERMVAPAGTDDWRTITDHDHVEFRCNLERRGFLPIPKSLMSDAVGSVAHANRFDSAQHWLYNLPAWDNVPRVATFFSTYMVCEDTEYTRALAVYMFTAMAGRVCEPGVKADMMPIFVGAQGIGKSTAVHMLSPELDFVDTVNLLAKDSDLQRKVRGKLVLEVDELRGMGTRDIESIRSFVSRQFEKARKLYAEYESTYPRRCILFGTTNEEEPLADPHGHRRFLPVRIGRCNREALARDRDQLWMEGLLLFQYGGVDWTVEALAKKVHADFEAQDHYWEIIADWLDTPVDPNGKTPRDLPFLRAVDVAQQALGISSGKFNAREAARISSSLKRAGYRDRKSNGRKIWERREQQGATKQPPSALLDGNENK